MTLLPETLNWISRAIGDQVVDAAPLAGGIAQTVLGVRSGRGAEFVLRLWSRPGWRETDPEHSPENEVAALTALAGSGLPVPALVAVDPTAEHGEYPALLMTKLPGAILHSATHLAADAEPLTPGMLAQLVEAAETLHAVPLPRLGRYAPYNDLSDTAPPEGTTDPALWERIYAVAADMPAFDPVFIHRDFHPGNTLWRDGQLTGLIDWTTAASGPAGVDAAHLRMNLVLAYGQETADLVPGEPYWDLRSLLDMADLSEDLPRVERYARSLLERA